MRSIALLVCLFPLFAMGDGKGPTIHPIDVALWDYVSCLENAAYEGTTNMKPKQVRGACDANAQEVLSFVSPESRGNFEARLRRIASQIAKEG